MSQFLIRSGINFGVSRVRLMLRTCYGDRTIEPLLKNNPELWPSIVGVHLKTWPTGEGFNYLAL